MRIMTDLSVARSNHAELRQRILLEILHDELLAGKAHECGVFHESAISNLHERESHSQSIGLVVGQVHRRAEVQNHVQVPDHPSPDRS